MLKNAQLNVDRAPNICDERGAMLLFSILCFPYRTSVNSILADCATLLHFREQVENKRRSHDGQWHREMV